MADAKLHRFVLLDGLRGAAALIVVQYHLSQLFGRAFFPRGYLAVDFFFMLSGFVLSFAYQSKLKDGLPSSRFLSRRLIRLYPLYLLGFLLGVCVFCLDFHARLSRAPHSGLAAAITLGLLLLPTPGGIVLQNLDIFPFNYPAWSLFEEATTNIVHVVALRRPGRKLLAGSLAIFGSLVVWSAIRFDGLNFGARWSNLPFGIYRALFGYIAGILLYSLYKNSQRVVPYGAFVSLALLVGVMATRVPSGWGVLFDLGAVFIVFPSIILIGAAGTVSKRLLPAAVFLGQISYGIYVLHVPLLGIFSRVWFHCFHQHVEQDVPIAGVAYLFCVMLITYAVDRVYDLPIRGYLHRKLSRRVVSPRHAIPPQLVEAREP